MLASGVTGFGILGVAPPPDAFAPATIVGEGSTVDLDKMIANKESLIPKSGANLVELDDFEEPGEQLSLIAHYETAEEAEEAKRERLAVRPNQVLYVYLPRTW